MECGHFGLSYTTISRRQCQHGPLFAADCFYGNARLGLSAQCIVLFKGRVGDARPSSESLADLPRLNMAVRSDTYRGELRVELKIFCIISETTCILLCKCHI